MTIVIPIIANETFFAWDHGVILTGGGSLSSLLAISSAVLGLKYPMISIVKIDAIIKDSKGTGEVKENFNKAVIQPWALASNFRSGKIGGWKDEFTEENIKYCEKILGKDLIRHGYEKDNNWAEMAVKSLDDLHKSK